MTPVPQHLLHMTTFVSTKPLWLMNGEIKLLLVRNQQLDSQGTMLETNSYSFDLSVVL